jgi:replication factor A1
VVENVLDWATITKKDGTETKKRSLTIRDDSGRSVELTLWGKYANEPGDHLFSAFQGGMRPVVAVKSARVGDFNGKTLSTVASSTVAVDPPDIPEAVQLRQWWASLGGCTGRLLGRRLVCAFPFHPTPRTPHPGTTRAPLQV